MSIFSRYIRKSIARRHPSMGKGKSAEHLPLTSRPFLRGRLGPWQGAWRRYGVRAIGNQNTRALGLTRSQTVPFDVPRPNLHNARKNDQSNEQNERSDYPSAF